MECDEKEDVIKRVSYNIKYCMNEKGVSQGDLRKKIRERRGYEISQSHLSRLVNGNLKTIPLMLLLTVCEALEVDVQKVVWENLEKNKILESPKREKNGKIIFCERENEFEKYLGKYHCYFYPTISKETKNNLLYGVLEFQLDEHTRECIAKFTIHVYGKENETKEYIGKLLLSTEYGCCYCYLMNETYGEVSFLIFDGLSSNKERLSCKMAAVLTPSAGGTRDATYHRMFISEKELSAEGIATIKPHLKINTAEICITNEKLEEFFKEMKVPEKFQKTIKCLTEPENLYALREEHFWGFGEKNMDSYDKNIFITKLREKSNAPNYQKIGKKLNDMLYYYLYKSEDNSRFFVE